MKGKGKKERYTHLNAEFQRIARRDKKVFLSSQYEEIEENNRMEKTIDLFKKIRYTKGTFHAKMGTIKDRNSMLLKCYTQYANEFGKLSSGHRTGKGQFSFQSQRKAMPKNAQTTTTVALISHASKVMLKILQARLQQYVNLDPPDVQAIFKAMVFPIVMYGFESWTIRRTEC